MATGMIGVQMMMLKDKVEELGAYEVLRRLAEIGYHSIEISQIPMTAENVAAIRKGCQEFDIVVAACSASLEPMAPGMPGEFLATDFDKIVADCKALDCGFLRVGMLPIPCMGSREKAVDFAARMDEMAERLAEHGIELYYHNHHVEFVKYDGVYLMDIIRRETKKIGFELDVHWIQRGGENPLTYIPQFQGRVRLLHLKDYRVAGFELPKGPFEPASFLQAFTGNIEFAEVGEGNLPMKEIIQVGLEAGSEHFLIEQDATYGRDPFDCLVTSRNNLIQLGFEAMFAPRR